MIKAIYEMAATSPDVIALSGVHGALTYAELYREIGRMAEVFTTLPPGPLALKTGNGPAWICADLAAVFTGRVTVPVPPFFSDEQIRHVIGDSGASCLLTEREDMPAFLPEKQLLLRESAGGEEFSLFRTQAERRSLPESSAKITFTSGTTGQPKGVCLSAASQVRTALALIDHIGREYSGRHMAVMPLSVLLENVAGLYTTLLTGGTYHIPDSRAAGLENMFRPDFARLARYLANEGITSIILVPELLQGLIAAVEAGIRLPEMRLVAVGGARVSARLLEKAEKCGLPVFQGYGLSEACSVVAFNTPSSNVPGSVGKCLDIHDVFLSPDNEVMLAEAPFLGYLGEGQPPSPFPTGDIGRMQDDVLFIDGRRKNVIVSSYGRNIAPEWPEAELLAHPAVAQAYVHGNDRPSLMALLVPSGPEVTLEELGNAVAAANRHLPEYARIKRWARSMPFTPANGRLSGNGKLRRHRIEKEMAAFFAAAYRAPEGYVETFFDRLVRETAEEREKLYAVAQIQAGLAGRISRETYIQYLHQAYHHVRHTVPLLMACGAALPDDKAFLRDALAEYIEEERGHEHWILNDIAAAGGDPEEAVKQPPLPETEFMVSYAYDFINRKNPVGFFGMVFVLEGTSTALATQGAKALARNLKLPERAFSYLLSHGALDISHMNFFANLVNGLEDEEDRQAIIHMAKRMFRLFANMFAAIPLKTV